ncbi:MAG: DNA cytosine methyltransferase [Chloroflexi bacterium]|nr:MAG: DNA cytosine methyltransferase [Chloroflexota bacterium]
MHFRSNSVRVIDIFCGAGGFSEGFRQAGFEVIWGVDKWEPAVITHRANHPSSQTVMYDVERLSLLPDEEFDEMIPDAEVIIGSPPCAAFSNSNKSGKGDKAEGIRLIEAFLRIVARKKWKSGSILRYWILENVPNSENYIQDSYTAKYLGLEGDQILQVKNTSSGIYNAVYYGVPSRRKRYFCGKFPHPEKTITDKADIVLLKEVLNRLGKPNEKYSEKIKDPNYEFELDGKDVSDHHYIQKLARHQWKTAKRMKQDKGYMGKMAFPENIEKPARTVMASMTFGARESMIYGNGRGSYRAPTIREIASLMSFPIDYRFYGKSIGLKYRLVGNAVPPKMAYALAKAITLKENIKPRETYQPIIHRDNGHFFDLNGQKISPAREKRRHPKSRFKYHIPYLIVDTYRVELTNHHSDFQNLDFKWGVEIHRSQGPKARVFTPNLSRSVFTEEELQKMDEFCNFLEKSLVSYDKFQMIYRMTTYERRKQSLIGPFELLYAVRDLIDNLARTSNMSIRIKSPTAPFYIPRKIGIGYYVLCRAINEMEKLSL